MKLYACTACGAHSAQRQCPDHRGPKRKGSTRKWRRLRQDILKRDKYICQLKIDGICTHLANTVDHIIPVSKGGSDHPTNLVAACEDCNIYKGDSMAPVSPAQRERQRMERLERHLEQLPKLA